MIDDFLKWRDIRDCNYWNDLNIKMINHLQSVIKFSMDNSFKSINTNK